MMTRITAAGARVTVWHDPTDTQAWHWEQSPTGGLRSREAGLPTLADAVADAQRHCGADVAISRHSNPEPQS